MTRDPVTEFAIDEREAELFRAVVDKPGDDEPRIAYAEYMKDVDPDRAELIRLQLGQREVWRRHGADFKVPEWNERVDELLRKNSERWLRGIDQLVDVELEYGWELNFHGGMIEEAAVGTAHFLANADILIRGAPLRFLGLGRVEGYAEELIDRGLPDQFVSVGFGWDAPADAVRRMANSERFAGLRAVSFDLLSEWRAVIDAVATSKYWRQLEVLQIRQHNFEDDHEFYGIASSDLGDEIRRTHGELPWLTSLSRLGTSVERVL